MGIRNGEKRRSIRYWHIVLALPLVALVWAVGQTGLDLSLQSAASDGNVAAIRRLCKLGADVRSSEDDRTALMFAVEGNHVESVKALLDLGANPNDRYLSSKGGDTVLERAVGEGEVDIVAELLRHGAYPNTVDEDHLTLLDYELKPDCPKWSSCDEIASLLRRYGAKRAAEIQPK